MENDKAKVCVHPIVPYFSRRVVAQLTRPHSAPEGCARHTTLVQGTRATWANHESAEWRLSFRREPCVVTVCFCGKPCKAIRRTSRPVVTCVHTLASSSGWFFCGMTTILHHRYWASISPPPLTPPLSSFHIFDVGCSIHGAGDITLQIVRSNSLQTRAEAEEVIGECPDANQRRGSRGSVEIPPLLKPWNTCSFSGEISIQLPSSLPTTA